MTPSRTIRIFISSTFRDMHSERDYLIKFVFPELRERCRKKGLQLIDVDLRWGVSEEDAEQGKALEICLDEIENCRPFFIGILGERYGWTPEKYQVPDYPRYDWVKEFEKGHSITALEIYQGVLKNPEMRPQAFFYFRNPDFIREVPVEKHKDIIEENQHAAKKLFHLKEDIKDTFSIHQLPGHITQNYPCSYKGIKINWAQVKGMLRDINMSDLQIIESMAGDDHLIDNEEWQRLNDKQKEIVSRYGVIYLAGLDDFGNSVLNDIWQAIEAQYPESVIQTDLFELERKCHQNYTEDRTRLFIGREDILNGLNHYLDQEGPSKPLMLVGEPGSGKSALMAMSSKIHSAHNPDCFTLIRYVGASPTSMDIYNLISNIIEEIAIHFDIPIDETRLENFEKLSEYFREILYTAATKGKLVMYIDALNQLNPINDPHYLTWLPNRLPEGVKIICSTLTGAYTEAAKKYELPVITAGKMSQENCRDMVEQILGTFRKTLSEHQLVQLLSKQESTKPLYLIIACEELRIFPSFEEISARIAMLSETIPGLFEQMFDRLEADHGRKLVMDSLCLIECSMYGLEEGEMLELLQREGEERLPLNVWARLFCNLSVYLTHTGESNDGLINFFHQQMSIAVKNRYLEAADTELTYIRILAKYGLKKYYTKDGKVGNTELYTGIYLYKVEDIESLYNLLKDIFESKNTKYERIATELYKWVVENYDFKGEGILKNVTNRIEEEGNKSHFANFLQLSGQNHGHSGKELWILYFFEKSVMIYESISKIESKNGPLSLSLAFSTANTARIYLLIGKEEKSLSNFEKSLLIMISLYEEEPENIEYMEGTKYVFGCLGNFFYRNGDFKKSNIYYNKSLKLAENLCAINPESLEYRQKYSIILRYLGRNFTYLNNYTNAKYFLQKSLQTYDNLQVIVGKQLENIEILFEIYHDLGHLHDTLNEDAKAIEYYEKSLKMIRILCEKKPNNTFYIHANSVCLNNLGRLFQKGDEIRKSLFYYGESTKIMEILSNQEPYRVDYKFELLVSYNNTGYIYDWLREFTKALDNYIKSMEISENLCLIEPDNIKYKIKYSKLLNSIGGVYLKINENDKALDFYQKSMMISEALSKIEPENIAYKFELSTNLTSIAKLYSTISKEDIALEYYEKSLQVIEYLCKIEPENMVYKFELSTNLTSIANLYSSIGKEGISLEYYEKSLQIAESIYNLEPENMDNRLNLSKIYQHLGIFYNNKHVISKTFEFFNKSLQFSEFICAIEPKNVNYRFILWKSLDSMSNLHKYLNEDKISLKYYNKALKIMNALYDQSLNNDIFDLSYIHNIYKLEVEEKKTFDENGKYYEGKMEYEESLDAYLKSLYVIVSLCAIEPEYLDFRYEFFYSLNKVGNIYKLVNNYEKAFEYYKYSFKVMQILCIEEPDRNDFRLNYAICHCNIYSVCDIKEEMKWIVGARKILGSIVENSINDQLLLQLWTVVNEAIEKNETNE